MCGLLLDYSPEGGEVDLLREGLLEFLHADLGADARRHETLDLTHLLEQLLLQVESFLRLLVAKLVDNGLHLRDIRLLLHALHN